MTVIGHRGAMGYEDENTLASFEKAISLGVKMIEYDVYALDTDQSLPAEESLVIIHDPTVDRTTNGKGKIMDYTPKMLQRLRTSNGHRIPTVKEVLDFVNRRVTHNIELKGPKAALRVAAVIEKYVNEKGWKYDDFIVSSFDHKQLEEFHKAMPQVSIGVLLENLQNKQVIHYARNLGATFVGPSVEAVTPAFIREAHANRLKCFVYTVNKPNEIKTMKRWWVDAVFSNYPDRVAMLLNE